MWGAPVLMVTGEGTRGQCPRTWHSASLAPTHPWPRCAAPPRGPLPEPSALCELRQLPRQGDASGPPLKPPRPQVFHRSPSLLLPDRYHSCLPLGANSRLSSWPPCDHGHRGQHLDPRSVHPPHRGSRLTCQGLLVVLPHGDEVPQAGVELLHDGLGERGDSASASGGQPRGRNAGRTSLPAPWVHSQAS